MGRSIKVLSQWAGRYHLQPILYNIHIDLCARTKPSERRHTALRRGTFKAPRKMRNWDFWKRGLGC